jgi:flagellar basal-body rod modification protein FlgD
MTSIDTSSALTTTTASASRGTAGQAGINADFNTFLQMLTTQLQNQDPLNPMESTEFAVQLATFSTVEQATKTNQLLAAMSSQMNLSAMADLAGWVGKEARAAMDVTLGDAPITFFASPVAEADSTLLVIRNSNDELVASLPVTADNETFVWDGRNAAGEALPAGRYSAWVEAYSNGDQISSERAQVYAEVIEARGGTDETVMVFTGGIEVAASEVTALRAP